MEQGSSRIREILAQISNLDDELREALHAQQSRIAFALDDGRVAFGREVEDAHRRLRIGLLRFLRRSEPRNAVTAPLVYAMLLPLVVLDAAVTLYQTVCFPLYRIPRVPRRRYIVIDRHHLAYLNAIEKLNCVYCGYANGLLAYAHEVVARTEQFWCPIKHAHQVLGAHRRYAEFLDYGDAEAWESGLRAQRARLRGEGEGLPASGPRRG